MHSHSAAAADSSPSRLASSGEKPLLPPRPVGRELGISTAVGVLLDVARARLACSAISTASTTLSLAGSARAYDSSSAPSGSARGSRLCWRVLRGFEDEVLALAW